MTRGGCESSEGQASASAGSVGTQLSCFFASGSTAKLRFLGAHVCATKLGGAGPAVRGAVQSEGEWDSQDHRCFWELPFHCQAHGQGFKGEVQSA